MKVLKFKDNHNSFFYCDICGCILEFSYLGLAPILVCNNEYCLSSDHIFRLEKKLFVKFFRLGFLQKDVGSGHIIWSISKRSEVPLD